MYDDLASAGDLLHDPRPPDDAGAIRFRRARDLGEVINATFRFLRETFRELGLGLVVVAGPLALIASALTVWAQGRLEQALTAGPDLTDPLAAFDSPAYMQWLVVTVALVLFVQLLLQSAVLGYVERYRRGGAGAIPPGELWEATKRALGPVVSTTLIVLGLALLSTVVMALPILGVLVWTAGLLYVAPIVSLHYVERVAEGDGFVEGFARTRALVRGHWWMTFGILIVAGLIGFVFSLVVAIPGGLLEAALGFSTTEGGGALRVVAVAVSALFGVLAYATVAVPTVAAAFQYFNLVERTEGGGLQAEVDRLATRRSPAPDDRGGRSWRGPSEPPDAPPGRGFRGGGFDEPERGA